MGSLYETVFYIVSLYKTVFVHDFNQKKIVFMSLYGLVKKSEWTFSSAENVKKV